MLSEFLYVLFFLVLLAVVGHSLWIFVAWLVRLLSGQATSKAGRSPDSEPPPSPSPSPSPPRAKTKTDETLDELETTKRRLTWLWNLGLMDRETYDKAIRAVHDGHRTVSGVRPLRGRNGRRRPRSPSVNRHRKWGRRAKLPRRSSNR